MGEVEHKTRQTHQKETKRDARRRKKKHNTRQDAEGYLKFYHGDIWRKQTHKVGRIGWDNITQDSTGQHRRQTHQKETNGTRDIEEKAQHETRRRRISKILPGGYMEETDGTQRKQNRTQHNKPQHNKTNKVEQQRQA